MAQAFVLGVNLRIQQVLGLEQVKQQLAGIQIGGVGQTQKLTTGLKDVGAAASTAAVGTAKAGQATTNLGKSAGKTGKQLKGAARQAQNFGDQIAIAGKRYAAFLGATIVAYKGLQVITAGTKSVIEFDQAMVSLSQIIDTTRDQLGGLEQQFLDLSVSTGTSASEIANAAKLLAQAGFRGSELTEAVEQLAKVPLTPIFENMDQAVDGAIAAMRQFSDEGLTVETVFDKMINVSNKYAASFPDIIEGLKRGGSAFQAIGGTLDEFIAAFTTIRSVTRESASSVGTSLKTLSSRLADPKIIKFLETKNIRLLEEGQFVGPLEAIRRIGDGLERTANVQDRINIATKLGGRRQISRFLAIAQNADKTSEILGVSKNSFDAFSRVAEQGLQAIGVQINILIAQAKKLAIELGEDLFIPFIKGLTGTAEAAIALLGALKPILPMIATIGTVFASGAVLKGIGGFLGPKLAGMAGPVAFAAAGGGAKGAAAGLGASPFIQAGLLIAAGQAAGALLKTADGAETFASTMVTSVATITAVLALMRGQTIAQFAMGGGLFPSLGKMGKLGAIGGSLATIGAVALPSLISSAYKSSQELMNKITDSAIETVGNIEIDPLSTESFDIGLSNLYKTLQQSEQQLIKQASVRDDPTARKIFAGIGRTIANLWEGDYEAIIRHGGVTKQDLMERFQSIIDKSPELINDIIDNIGNVVAGAGINLQKHESYARQKIISSTEAGGAGPVEAATFADVVINSVGSLEEFTSKVRESAAKILEETMAREKLAPLIKTLVPTRLVGQLLQFSKSVDAVIRSVDLSAKMFTTQISDIEGGIGASAFDFDFSGQQIKQFIGAGGLEELFAFTPDIPKFIGGLTEVENLLDAFIISISNIPTDKLDPFKDVDKFFERQTHYEGFDLVGVPKVVKDNFEEFFRTIAADIALVSEGEYIDADEIKKRFEKEFANLGAGATDAVVENIRGFLEATFTQIEDELNRLATVRKFELAAPVLPGTQAAFLEQQLGRVGIGAGGTRPTNVLRGTMEELELRRQEKGEIYGYDPFRRLPTPEPGFFQDRTQGLVDIAGDERTRQRVRDGFQDVVIASAKVKAELAELKPGTEGFLDAAERAKALSSELIEFQTAMEALTRASGRALESEKRTLTLRQQFAKRQLELSLIEGVQKGYDTPLEAQRALFDFSEEQKLAQVALQDKYSSIIEKDNMLRVDLAKEISANTKTQAEVTQNFDLSVNTFTDATRIQAATIDLMHQHIQQFGQSIVNFKNLGAPVGPVSGGTGADITSTQIRSGDVTIQQSYDEFNKLLNEGNASQNEMLDILGAILERQGDIQPTGQGLSITKKEKEDGKSADEKISQLTESLDNLRAVLGEPSELKLVTDQHIALDLSTLPLDISEEIRPLLEEAVMVAAKTVTRKALESLAAKSDSELSIAATDIAGELV